MTTPASFEVLNDESKIDDIVAKAKSNRGNRIYNIGDISLITNIPSSKKKPSIVAMCSLWLEDSKVSYGVSTAEEIGAARFKDASDRYDKTNVVVNLFCETNFAGESRKFRWSQLSDRAQVRCMYVLEHIVMETLSPNFNLPLHLAKDSWATSHLLSVAIRNNAKKKPESSQSVSYILFFFLNVCITHIFIYLHNRLKLLKMLRRKIILMPFQFATRS